MRWITLVLTLALAACRGDGDDITIILPWHTPTCDVVRGEPVATYSPDKGVTVRPTERIVDNPEFRTRALTAASEAAVLYAAHGRGLYISHDAGCSWQLAYEHEFVAFEVVAGERNGFAWASSLDEIIVLSPTGSVDMRSKPQTGRIQFLATSPSDPGAVYLVSDRHGGPSTSRQLFRSTNEGLSWSEVSDAAPGGVQGLAINPADSMHMVATSNTQSVSVSFDGGITWMESEGIIRGAANWRTRPVVFGGDGLTEDVWVAGGREFWDEDGAVTHREEFVARSVDGGLTFEDAFHSGEGIVVSVNTQLATIPGVAGEVFANNRDCPILTPRLFHYRASDDSVTILDHSDRRFGFSTLVFNPIDPDVLYLGFFENVCPG